MKSEIVYMPLNVFKNKKLLAPFNLDIQVNEEELKVILMDQERLTDMEENERVELIESLSNSIYPLYFQIEMPKIYLEEFEQLFNSNKNEYAIIRELESQYCYYLSLKIQDCDNFKKIIKELAWVNGSGYKLLWSINPFLFNSQSDKKSSIIMKEKHTIFMIGEPEGLVIIITNENRFRSFEKIKEVLPSSIVPTLYEYD